jgi:hypothetical protein
LIAFISAKLEGRMSDNDGGDGIELRNTNGKNAAEAVSIAKGQKLRIEGGYRFHSSNALVTVLGLGS